MLTGTLVNVLTVLVGGAVGLLLKKGIPERLSDIVMKALGLCVLYIGITGVLKGQNTLVLILSMVLGTILGELLDIDLRLKNLGDFVQRKFAKGKDGDNNIANGFVSASLLFCVGAMAIVGSLQSGLTGNHEMLFTKSMLDMVSSCIFASAFGAGVLLSGAAVLVYQGAITLAAGFVAPLLSDYVIGEMTCAGSLIIIGLALNMLGITKIKVSNMIPAIFIPILLCIFMKA